MAGIKSIIGAFRPFGEAADPFMLTQGVELIPAPCYQFMGIRLVPNVPDQFVRRCVKNMMQSQG